MFEKSIREFAMVLGMSEINVALIVGFLIGILLRSMFSSKRRDIIVSSPITQSTGQEKPSVSFMQAPMNQGEISTGSTEPSSFNSRMVVTINGREVQVDGEKIVAEIRKGNLISAIKILRQETGLGLKDSKQFIESFGKIQDPKK